MQNLYRNYAYTNKLKQIEQSDLLMKIGEIEERNQVNYANSQKMRYRLLLILKLCYSQVVLVQVKQL